MLRRRVRLFLRFTPFLFLWTALPASGQFLSLGVKAGVPLTSALSTGQTGSAGAVSYDRPYIVGPTAELHLPFHLSFEVDALYRRNGFTYYSSGSGIGTPFPLPASANRTTINDWQFPLLGKYEKSMGPLRPFVDAGIVYRHLSTGNVVLFAPGNPNTTGFAVGGGVSLNLVLIRLTPELRYTHWFTPPFPNGELVVGSTTNQADFLVGVSF
jgi:hypothetical protein